MWSVVIGQTFWMLNRSARTQISCSATRLERHAICSTQLTVGLLSLKSAMRFSVRIPHTCSITSHRSTRPASSRSKFVIVPFGLASDFTLAVMSGGHCSLKTVGRHSDSSPMMTPPAPWLDASTTPINRANPPLVRGSEWDGSLILVKSCGSLILPHVGTHCDGNTPLVGIFSGDGCTVRGVPGRLVGR